MFSSRIRLFFHLRRTSRAAAPRAEFHRDLWQRLSHEMTPAPRASFFQMSRVAMAGALASFLVLISGAGTAAYAYESPLVTPEHPLYAVRLGVEKVAEVAAVTPALKERARLVRVVHRLTEAEHLKVNSAALPRVMEKLEKEYAPASADAVIDKPKISVASTTPTRDDAMVDRLENLAKKRPEVALPSVRRVLKLDEKRLERQVEKVTDVQKKAVLERMVNRRKQTLEAIHREEKQEEPAVREVKEAVDLKTVSTSSRRIVPLRRR